MSAAAALNWSDASQAAPAAHVGGKRRSTPRGAMSEIENVFVHQAAPVAAKPSQPARQQQSTCPWGTEADVVPVSNHRVPRPSNTKPSQQQENGHMTARQEAAAIKARNSNSSGMSGILG